MELYSNAEDCLTLAKILKKKLENKIEFMGSAYQEIPSGKYFSYPRFPHSEIDYLFEKGLPFYYKYCENGFLRIQIGSNYREDNSFGEKLAALSAFYEVLSENFGEPTVFYTTKDDEAKLLSLQWSFENREKDIELFKNGTYFDDAEIDKLIIIGEEKFSSKLFSKQLGLPLELIDLVMENIEEYIKYKPSEKLPLSTYDKILALEKTRKK